MTKEEREAAIEAIRKALQLKSDKSFVLLIKNNKTNSVSELACDVKTERDFIEILINPLLGHFSESLIRNNILDLDTQLLFLKGFFESLESQYKERHLNNIL
jgi:altronate dehydratase